MLHDFLNRKCRSQCYAIRSIQLLFVFTFFKLMRIWLQYIHTVDEDSINCNEASSVHLTFFTGIDIISDNKKPFSFHST